MRASTRRERSEECLLDRKNRGQREEIEDRKTRTRTSREEQLGKLREAVMNRENTDDNEEEEGKTIR